MFHKRALRLFIGISLFVAGYLYYVHHDRQQSIAKFFDNPKVGDIYKIEKEDDEGKYTHYWKVMETHEKGLVFVPSKFKAWGSIDYLQRSFDEMLPFSYTHEQLKALRDGKLNSWEHDNLKLIDIVRKQ
ncbi:hypothetical protein [Aridibaculum aurantiacum]|uniref:hypothetical protein n=1 Tax=Aridibaculum aurantiacum TaxID=2810307 RepID=UPI001A960C2B|nr:hypothetical protein [Aridibaculum aurantiacum]